MLSFDWPQPEVADRAVECKLVDSNVTEVEAMSTDPLMRFSIRLMPLLALLAASVCGPARATDYEVGPSLVCDTQGEAERYVALFSGDTQAAIDAVNAEERDPTACALVNVAYLRGPHMGMARNGDNAFEIVRILVVGIDTAAGLQAVQPAVYFSLFGVKEYAV
jgi:hypothetical protein